MSDSRSVRISAGGLRIEDADGTVTEFTADGMTITPPRYEGPRTLAAQQIIDLFGGIQQDMLHEFRMLSADTDETNQENPS